jgi:hypothetical protein
LTDEWAAPTLQKRGGVEQDDDTFETTAWDLKKNCDNHIIDSGLLEPVEIAAEYMKYLDGPHHDPHRVAVARELIEEYARYRLGLPETKH